MDLESGAQYLMKECNIDHGMAIMALIHARGSIPMAKDFLTSETCRHIYGRQARECDVD